MEANLLGYAPDERTLALAAIRAEEDAKDQAYLGLTLELHFYWGATPKCGYVYIYIYKCEYIYTYMSIYILRYIMDIYSGCYIQNMDMYIYIYSGFW